MQLRSLKRSLLYHKNLSRDFFKKLSDTNLIKVYEYNTDSTCDN